MLIIKNAGQAKQREQFIELFKFLAERRIMGIESMEDLIETTIVKIKTALDNDKPGEAKVYTEMLVLLRQTQDTPSPNWAHNKPFEKISEKHIPDAVCIK